MNSQVKSWGLITFTVSLCSYLYELVLIQLAGELSNNNFLIINLSLGSFILGLGLGLNELPELLTKEEAKSRLSLVERDLCYIPLLAWALIQLADFIQQHFIGLIMINEVTSPWFITAIEQYYLYILSGSVLASILIGFKSGQELPLILKIMESEEHYTAFFLGLTYLGSMAAAVALNFFLKTFFSIEVILLLTVSINFIVFVYLQKGVKSFPTLLVLIAMSLFYIHSDKIVQFNLKNYYYHFSSLSLSPENFTEVKTRETAYQKIHLHENSKKKIVLSLNRQFQFSFNNENIYHDALIHLPLKMTNLRPKSVLLLGGGDGLALRELLKYPDIKIRHLELDEEFTEYCQKDPLISKLNNNSLDDNKRVNRTYGDAFSLIKYEKSKYDLIIVDFPYPFSYDIWKLYSVEFYLSLKRLMNENTILVIDAPVQSQLVSKIISAKKSEKLNSTVFSTLKKAGFEGINFYSLQKEGFLIISLKEREIRKNNLNEDFLSKETIKKLKNLGTEEFNYYYSEKLINSIFRPQFLDFSRDF